MNDGPGAEIDPVVRDGADRPRDPPPRPPVHSAPAHVDLRRRRRVRPDGPGSSPSRTSSRRWSGRSRTRPIRAALRQLTNGEAPSSATSPTPGSSSRSRPTPSTRSAATCSRGDGAPEARRHDHRRRLQNPRRVGAGRPDPGSSDPRFRPVLIKSCRSNPHPSHPWRYLMWVVRFPATSSLRSCAHGCVGGRRSRAPWRRLIWRAGTTFRGRAALGRASRQPARRQGISSEAHVIWDLSGRRRTVA